MRARSFITVLVTLLASGAEAVPYVVRGQVVTAEGALPGAEVRLVHQPPWTFHWPEDAPGHRMLEPIRTTSGDDGRFEIAIDLTEIDSHNARWLLEVSTLGLARRILEVPPQMRRARAGATEELGGVLLSPGVLVRGRAVGGASGDVPLAGVRVALWRSGVGTHQPRIATTDDAGGFQFPDVAPGELDAVLDLEGFAPRHLERLRIQVGSPPNTHVDLGAIALVRALSLHGRVVDAAAKPLAGVRVRFRHDLPSAAPDWLPIPETETGPQGEFRLDAVPPEPGPSYHFRFDKQGYRWRLRELVIAPDAGGLRLAPVTLTEALILAGRVRDPSGQPIAGAQVTPVLDEETYDGVRTHQTDDGGRFRIDHIAGTTGRLHIQARGFVATEVEVEASPETAATPGTGTGEARPTEPVSIALEPMATTDLTITVRDARGRPIAGAEVQFSFHDDRGGYHETVLTDAAGRCQLDRVPVGGPCWFSVRHPEHPHWSRNDLVVEAGQRSLSVDLDPAPWKLETVRGRVNDGEAGEDRPIPGAEVSLSTPHGSSKYRVRTSDDGRFELRRVKEGAYRLIATAPGRAPAELPVKVAAGLDTIEVVLGAGTVLRGTIAGLTMELLKAPETRVYANWISEMREATVDGERYRIDHLGAGRWSVTATAGEAHVGGEIEIEPGQTEARLDFEFPTGHQVSSQLLIDGRPPPKVAVSLQTTPEAPASGSYSAHTEADGRFVFSRVVAGPYHLTYNSQAGSIRRPVLVDSDVDLLIDVDTVPLRGRVVDAATAIGVAGVTVRAFPEVVYSHGPRWDAVAGATGWFEIGRVLPGRWTLFVQAPGFLEQRLEVAVDAMTEPPILELAASEGLHIRVETSAPLPYSVELQLRDSDGEQVARGHVTLEGAREGHWSQAPRGRFRLWASNKLSWIQADVEIPGPVVTLRFPPAGALRLRVPELELESKVPWKPAVPVQVEAILELPDDPAFDGPHCRRSRFLRLKSLTPGLWRIEVRTADGRTWTGSALVVDGRSSEVLLALQ